MLGIYPTRVKWEYTYSYDEFGTIKRNVHTEFVVYMLAHARDFILVLELDLK